MFNGEILFSYNCLFYSYFGPMEKLLKLRVRAWVWVRVRVEVRVRVRARARVWAWVRVWVCQFLVELPGRLHSGITWQVIIDIRPSTRPFLEDDVIRA